jgi:hypothetical protein
MEVGCVQHVISQMTHKKTAGEVAMERLGQEFVFSYFIHVFHK